MQQRCHKCNRVIPRQTGVFRNVKIGVSGSGGDHYRDVILCPRCGVDQDDWVKQQKIRKVLLLCGSIVVAAGALVYWFYVR